MQNENEDDNILENIIKNIIENKIRILLEIISKNYSTKFKKEEIDNELQYIIKHINLKLYSKNIPIETVPETAKLDIPKKLILKNRVNSSMKTTPNIKTTKKIKQIKDENRCCSRIWSTEIIERNTMTKITAIPDRFKVVDFKDINVKEFHKKYIIGLQCKKGKYKDSKYCKLHTYHLIHGDYKEIPSNEICYHFMKDGNYL